ncbi:uncharacterized protein LOC121388329 isoform X2 [Gigantopelta aegis]|uniref:uncharacterized protein LOC121388329 isoform X2 n=1 Tax=Gigantopelta aegis TaxID=1735272 RepID=UPI001B8895BB|nr:uncharacterized protein LOC121388329 isoform X2 [Gigantopelta aegis]
MSWQHKKVPTSNGAYLFVRFPTSGGSNLGVVGQACVLASSNVRNFRGRFLGIARKIFESGYSFRGDHYHKDEACVVFLFPDREAAIKFFVSDKNFKQPDFPPPAGACEAWTIDRYYTPEDEADYSTFMISEIRLTKGSYLDLKHQFASPFANMMLDHAAHPFVVQTDDIHSLRRHYKDPHTVVNVHLFRTPSQMGQIMKDYRYDSLQRIQNELGSEYHTVFTLDPEACP